MFSIIIPVGPGRTALSALESLLYAGLHDADEVLIVGDGREVPIPSRFKDLPIRAFSTPSAQGANAARNLGAQNARNGILCFLDDDDQYAPGSLGKIAAYVSVTPTVGAWSMGWRCFSGKKQVFANYPRRITEKSIWKRNRAGGCSSMVVRKPVFEEAGGFDPVLPSMQDWDLWLRLSRLAEIRRIAEPLIHYNDQPGDRISTNHELRLRGLEALLRKNASRWPAEVRAFHKARIAAIRHRLGDIGRLAVFQRSAPLSSLYFLLVANLPAKIRPAGRNR